VNAQIPGAFFFTLFEICRDRSMSGCGCGSDQLSGNDQAERKVLIILLVINAVMFLIELVAGLLAESTGLLADSLDMLADAMVYGVALYAVGRSLAVKRHAALFSGIAQITLAIGVALDVLRRAYFGSEPVSDLMMAVGALALVANLTCLALLAQHRDGEVHMRASWIFSVNDVLANLGVIVAGGLVWWLGARWPDLLIGSVIAVLVLRGGITIVKEARQVATCHAG
jgi:cation diffusion facilitator family transporter